MVPAVALAALIVVAAVADRATGTGPQAVYMDESKAGVVRVEGTIENGFADLESPHEPYAFETVQGTLLEVCESRGYGEDCARTLLGMLWKESLNDAQAIGDGGRARGYFQIHYRLHGISVECAEDLVCSANWTVDYLESNGYPRYKSHAVQCHNGCLVPNGYAASALRWGDRKWGQPMFVGDTAATLAMN